VILKVIILTNHSDNRYSWVCSGKGGIGYVTIKCSDIVWNFKRESSLLRL